jgi:DeoR-like protein with HTH domain
MKTNKHQTLLLVNKKRGVRPRDVVQHFGYSPGTARSYLSYLSRQGPVERFGVSYVLTARGQDRLQYFDVAGCADPACPLCQGKAGYLTCPSCGYQIPKQKAKILNEQDFFFVVRHAGVYCPWCWKLIFSETQARLLRIREEV